MGHRRLCLLLVPHPSSHILLSPPISGPSFFSSSYHFIFLLLLLSNYRAIFYQMSIGACGFALASEVSSLPLRAQTQGFVGLTQTSVGWVVGFVVPYIINPDAGNLGGKIGYIFFGLGCICFVGLYFYCPETKGLNYDEVSPEHPHPFVFALPPLLALLP